MVCIVKSERGEGKEWDKMQSCRVIKTYEEIGGGHPGQRKYCARRGNNMCPCTVDKKLELVLQDLGSGHILFQMEGLF